MSRGNGCIGRFGQGLYEDASDLSSTSRACRTRRIWRMTRHTDKRAALYTAADRPANQSYKRVASWTGKLPDTPDTRDKDVTKMLRRCYEETASALRSVNNVNNNCYFFNFHTFAKLHICNKKHLKNVGPIRHCEPPHALILH